MAKDKATLTNPARRLHSILSGDNVANPAQLPLRRYLAARFGGDEKDDLEMFRKLLAIYDLVAITDQRFALMRHPKRATFVSCIKPIVTALQQTQLNTPMSHMTNQLANGPLPILDLAADVLDIEQPEYLIDQGELDRLLKEAEEMKARIQESDVPLELKQILLGLIERIKRAIIDYPLSGAEGLDKTIKEAYGTAFVEHAVVLPQKENPVVKGFWDWLGRLNSVVSACKTAYSVGQIASEAVFNALDYFK
jgi:hypothetical protein